MLALHYPTLVLLLSVLTAAVPLKTTKSCMADSLVLILQGYGNGAVSFCRGIAASVTVTATATSTALWANTTVTNTVVSQPTLIITIDADTVTTITTTAVCSKTSMPIDSATALASILKGHVESRDIATPLYLSKYSPSQIASACGCLGVVGSATTVTSVALISSVVPTVTEVYTAIGTPAVDFTTIMATMTFVKTVCLGGPTTTAAPVGPRQVN
ncbi:hypothetical protein MMC32_004454 [Xylographa parallela]|nr:hypothetical protein [Xylographa parallela]